MSWFAEHAALVANMASMAMLLVWVFYTALFYRDFRQQRMPLIVLHQAHGHGLESSCLLVNMSKQPIHVLCVMMAARTENDEVTMRITNSTRVSPVQTSHKKVQDLIKQGPLPTGYFLDLGSFQEMLERVNLVAAQDPAAEEAPGETLRRQVHEVEIRVIALHGAYQDPIGAVRSFRVAIDGEELSFQPDMLLTKQMVSRVERRRVRRWLVACLPAASP
jgi:hypothetical protein